MSSSLAPAERTARAFSALGDPTRLALLARLSDGRSCSIAALAADSRFTRQAVTRHLGVLEEAGLVARRRVGRESLYAYRPEQVLAARAWLDRVEAQWEGTLKRFKARVEGG